MTHGSISTYSHQRCRCPECKSAWNSYQYELRRRRKQNSVAIPHGTPGGYSNYLCRCPGCKDAASRANWGYKQVLRTT